MLPIMPALCLILNSAYYANNYAGIFDAGLQIMCKSQNTILNHDFSIELTCSYKNSRICVPMCVCNFYLPATPLENFLDQCLYGQANH